MHNKCEGYIGKTFIAPTSLIIVENANNRNKSAILKQFSAIIELVRELVISNMPNKFGKDT